MSKFPVESTDGEGIIEGLNYVLSGPTSLGQQQQGFASSGLTRITGNYRLPYTDSNNNPLSAAKLYIAPIALSTSEWLDDFTWKFTYTTPQPDPVFAIGNNITIDGVTPSAYNGFYSPIGVVKSTTTYVIIRTRDPYPNPGTGTGGTASLWVTSEGGATMSTDANAIVSVDAGSSLVNVSGQLKVSPFDYAVFSTDYPSTVPQMTVSVQLNRYKAFNSGTAAIPQYFYDFDYTLAEQIIYSTSLTSATQGIPASYTVVSGTSAVGSAGIYTSVTSSSTSGLGTGARISLNITADGTPYSTGSTILSVDGGGNYAVGDTVTWLGSLFGGVDGVNDLVLQVATITGSGDITVPASEVIFTPVIDTPSSGLYWYIIEVKVDYELPAEVAVKSMALGRRTLTAQVIKK